MPPVTPSLGLLLATVIQGGLLIALFSVGNNSTTDSYFMSKLILSPDVILQINHIANQTHPRGWMGPTLPVSVDFFLLPVATSLGIALTFGLFILTWTYRMSTSADMTMESYSPETMVDHVQWDTLFNGYLLVEHGVAITMLCSPLSFSFLVLLTFLITLAIMERCAPRAENMRGDAAQQFATFSLMAGGFAAFQILNSIKRHLHSSGIFFILHVLLDLLLILGHTWDTHSHQFITTMNCRSFFVVSSSALLFTIFLTHCTHIAGRDAVVGMVSGIYDHSEAK
jgi:hypothetical protein